MMFIIARQFRAAAEAAASAASNDINYHTLVPAYCHTVVKHGQLQNAAKAESCPLRENATGRF